MRTISGSGPPVTRRGGSHRPLSVILGEGKTAGRRPNSVPSRIVQRKDGRPMSGQWEFDPLSGYHASVTRDGKGGRCKRSVFGHGGFESLTAHHSRMAQLAGQVALNHSVEGSNPSAASSSLSQRIGLSSKAQFSGRETSMNCHHRSVVDRRLCNPGVGSSNLSGGSIVSDIPSTCRDRRCAFFNSYQELQMVPEKTMPRLLRVVSERVLRLLQVVLSNYKEKKISSLVKKSIGVDKIVENSTSVDYLSTIYCV